MKITREIKTAILVIASILLFIWGYSFLKGRDLFVDYKTFYIQYDNVEGLLPAAPVTINGFVVGKVSQMGFVDNLGKIQVEIQIKADFPFSKSSIAYIYEPGLIGGKQIMISPNFDDKSVAEEGMTLQGGLKLGLTDLVAEKLVPLQVKLESMVLSADELLKNLNVVLDNKTKEHIKSSIANLDAALVEFKGASKTINKMLIANQSKVDESLTNVNKITSDFSKISDSLASANIGQTVENLKLTLANVDKILTDVQTGKGSLGKLAKDEALYDNFTQTSEELGLLLQDLRLNPTRYVNVSLFGKKNKPYKSPNDSIKNVKN